MEQVFGAVAGENILFLNLLFELFLFLFLFVKKNKKTKKKIQIKKKGLCDLVLLCSSCCVLSIHFVCLCSFFYFCYKKKKEFHSQISALISNSYKLHSLHSLLPTTTFNCPVLIKATVYHNPSQLSGHSFIKKKNSLTLAHTLHTHTATHSSETVISHTIISSLSNHPPPPCSHFSVTTHLLTITSLLHNNYYCLIIHLSTTDNTTQHTPLIHLQIPPSTAYTLHPLHTPSNTTIPSHIYHFSYSSLLHTF